MTRYVSILAPAWKTYNCPSDSFFCYTKGECKTTSTSIERFIYVLFIVLSFFNEEISTKELFDNTKTQLCPHISHWQCDWLYVYMGKFKGKESMKVWFVGLVEENTTQHNKIKWIPSWNNEQKSAKKTIIDIQYIYQTSYSLLNAIKEEKPFSKDNDTFKWKTRDTQLFWKCQFYVNLTFLNCS